MNPFDSKTFNTNTTKQDCPGGAAFFNNSLVYVISRDGKLRIVTCTPPAGQDNWQLVTPPETDWDSYWSEVQTSTKAPSGRSIPLVLLPSSDGGSGLYAVGSNSTVYAMSSDQHSFTPISIVSANGSAVETCGATAWGNYLVVGWWFSANNTNMLMWDAYDVTQLPNPINSQFIWHPVQESGGTPDFWGLSPGGLGEVMSMDWYTLGGNNFYMVTSYMNGTNPVLLVTPMQGPVPQVASGGAIPYKVMQNTGGATGISVLRDPAGRIRLYSVSNQPTGSKGQQSLLASVATIPTIADPFGSDSPWTGNIPWSVIGDGRSANQTPVGCFLLGSPYNTEDPVGSANDVYEIALFSPDHDDSIWADISAYGTAQLLPNYKQGTLLPNPPPNSYIGAISGIVDSPIPIPASNIQNGNYEPGTKFGSVLFGATQSETSSHDASFSYSVGVSSTMQTSAGVGPAWDISLSGGQTSGSGGSNSVSSIENIPVFAELDSGGVLEPYGAFYASGVTFQYNWYRFLDLQGNWVADGPLFCTIVPILQDALANSFESYLVTPGDLSSYTRESINARAIELGLVPNGTDYVTSVIEANALPIGVGGALYLEQSISNNTQINPGYVQSQDDWKESGWTFDASAYVGFSYGLSVSMDTGVTFAGFTAEDLAGFTLSANESATTDKASQLQIQLDVDWPTPILPTDINRCNFRVYFLPANQRWAQELAGQVPQLNLDTNSQPWRILFLVDSYSSQDLSIHYP